MGLGFSYISDHSGCLRASPSPPPLPHLLWKQFSATGVLTVTNGYKRLQTVTNAHQRLHNRFARFSRWKWTTRHPGGRSIVVPIGANPFGQSPHFFVFCLTSILSYVYLLIWLLSSLTGRLESNPNWFRFRSINSVVVQGVVQACLQGRAALHREGKLESVCVCVCVTAIIYKKKNRKMSRFRFCEFLWIFVSFVNIFYLSPHPHFFCSQSFDLAALCII